MKLSEKDDDSTISLHPSPDDTPVAGPSSSNGHAKKASASGTNGSTEPSFPRGQTHIAKVALPGTALYDDSSVDREEYVRLVIQSLRDIGYIEAAATLEAESGYVMESPEVAEFRQCILEASWTQAEAALARLGVTDPAVLAQVRFLINRQHYLELLEAGNATSALFVLRQQLAPLQPATEDLQALSSLLMCADADELRSTTGWDGAAGVSRRQLLSALQRFIPSSMMIPPRRMGVLLSQAQAFQRQRCIYHNAPHSSMGRVLTGDSLYADHACDTGAFPRVTTLVLDEHEDEVWTLSWSHAGDRLATGGKDKRVIVWRLGADSASPTRECLLEWDLRSHPYPINCITWSLDDTVLVTAADNQIRLWNMHTGHAMQSLEAHTETVSALVWLPDDSGFISAGMDRKIIVWDAHGKQRDSWGTTAIRITDLAVTPDQTRVVVVGVIRLDSPSSPATPATAANATGTPSMRDEFRMDIYNFATKQLESTVVFDGSELTSINVTADSQHALINHAPDEIFLWDLSSGRSVRKLSGHQHSSNVIRSCLGGVDENFVASGSEDSNVYIWHRDSGRLLETLSGHGEGCINAVAWNPRHPRMFASCSDDHTVRIWEPPPPVTLAPVSALDGTGLMHDSDGMLDSAGTAKDREIPVTDGVELDVSATTTSLAEALA